MEASNLHNHLTALGENIVDWQLINIVLNGLSRSFDMVIQGIFYMTNPTFEDIMGKIPMESQQMAIHKNKIGQEEALAVHFCSHNYFHQGNFNQTGNPRRGRDFAQPTGLYY